jgi:hypothetical protein
MQSTLYRVAALVAVALWIGALFLPYRSAAMYGEPSSVGGLGYLLANWGWIGPVTGAIA